MPLLSVVLVPKAAPLRVTAAPEIAAPVEVLTVPDIEKVWTLAVQLAVVPPFDPAQLHVHGPLPPTALAVPVLHKLVVGADVRV